MQTLLRTLICLRLTILTFELRGIQHGTVIAVHATSNACQIQASTLNMNIRHFSALASISKMLSRGPVQLHGPRSVPEPAWTGLRRKVHIPARPYRPRSPLIGQTRHLYPLLRSQGLPEDIQEAVQNGFSWMSWSGGDLRNEVPGRTPSSSSLGSSDSGDSDSSSSASSTLTAPEELAEEAIENRHRAIVQAYKNGKLGFGFSAGGLLFPYYGKHFEQRTADLRTQSTLCNSVPLHVLLSCVDWLPVKELQRVNPLNRLTKW